MSSKLHMEIMYGETQKRNGHDDMENGIALPTIQKSLILPSSRS
jgi:hypothetical protein